MEQRQSIAKAIVDIPLGETKTYKEIMGVLMQEYDEQFADNLFNKALKKGIIDERDDGDYGIPIPSMQTWLIEAYGRKQADMPEIENDLQGEA